MNIYHAYQLFTGIGITIKGGKMHSSAYKISQFLKKYPNVFINDPAYQLRMLRYAPEMSEIIWEIKRALKQGVLPKATEHGSSDTYFLCDEDEKPLAIFKIDHYLQEYIAYRLDHQGFAGVPPTVITTLSHPFFGGEVTGSCQLFIEDTVTAVELPVHYFSQFSQDSIRAIAQLDIRIINEDRHTSNVLVRNKKEVIPIDHGFCLPEKLKKISYVWMYWDQAQTSFSAVDLDYISFLDPEKDRALLIEEVGFSEKVANRMYVATMLLKIGAIQGFRPTALGDILSKTYEPRRRISFFEQLIEQIKKHDVRDWITFSCCARKEIEIILGKYEAYQQKNFSIFG